MDGIGAGEDPREIGLERIERGEAVPLDRVADLVDEAGVAVDRRQMARFSRPRTIEATEKFSPGARL